VNTIRRFRGKLDPYFRRKLKPARKLRTQSQSTNLSVDSIPPGGDETLVPQEELKNKLEQLKLDQSQSLSSNIDGEKLSSHDQVKQKTIVRELIDLGKRGAYLGSEGYWDNTADPIVETIIATQKRQQREILKKREPGEWNKLLDSGRVKKIKTKPSSDYTATKANLFQNFSDKSKQRSSNQFISSK
jgi:hypothetical protein